MSGHRFLECRVTGDGSETIMSGLMSWRLQDEAGSSSDKLTLTVSVDGVEGLPKSGGKISFAFGTGTGLVDKGEFTITSVDEDLAAPQVDVVCEAAAFSVEDPTRFRLKRSVTYEGPSLGDLVTGLMSPHGYDVVVDPDLAGIVIDHIDQDDETDMQFVRRLSKKYDALAKPTEGKFVFARRGRVKKMTGADVPVLVVRRGAGEGLQLIGGRCSPMAGRSSFTGVRGRYYDPDKAEEVTKTVGSSPFTFLRQVYPTEDLLMEALDGELRRLTREGRRISLQVHGDPRIVAEGIVELADGFRSTVRGRWSVDSVVHSGAPGQGCLSQIVATKPVE